MSIHTKLEVEFDTIQENLSASSAYNETRKGAFESYKKLGIPTAKHEDWKYSSLKGLDKFDYVLNSDSKLTAEELSGLPLSGLEEGIQLVFVNGKLSEELSSFFEHDKIRILSLKDAATELPDLLNQHYGKSLEVEKEGLSALNVALATEGVVIHVLQNQTLETPIVIRHINVTGEADVANSVHHLVVVEKNAEVKVAEFFQNIGSKSAFSNVVTEIFVDKDARVDYYKIQDENDESFHVGTTQVVQKDKSYFYAATFTVNGGFVRNNLNLVLDGEYIESHMYGLYIPNGKQHVDNHTLVDHRKPNCESNELYKGVMDDKSKGVFNGKIFVREDAQKTNAYQNCKNVILSESASMNTKPQLEIWADDVKCSHGTTTGKLDEEAIFYMQSRGIPKAEAIKLQIVAFAEDVVSQIKWDALREELDTLIVKKLQ